MKFLTISFLILLFISCVSAQQVDIIYPNENITTDIYYSTGNNMFNIQNNTLNTTEDITVMIIKNQYESVDIIGSPEKIVNYGVLIFWIIFIISMVLCLIFAAKRMFK